MQDEIELIRELGCSHIQGYVYGKPARAAEVLQAARRGGRHGDRAPGYRISRSPRTTMLRTARIDIRRRHGRSAHPQHVVDRRDDRRRRHRWRCRRLDVLIELLDDQMFPAQAALGGGRQGRARIRPRISTWNGSTRSCRPCRRRNERASIGRPGGGGSRRSGSARPGYDIRNPHQGRIKRRELGSGLLARDICGRIAFAENRFLPFSTMLQY